VWDLGDRSMMTTTQSCGGGSYMGADSRWWLRSRVRSRFVEANAACWGVLLSVGRFLRQARVFSGRGQVGKRSTLVPRRRACLYQGTEQQLLTARSMGQAWDCESA